MHTDLPLYKCTSHKAFSNFESAAVSCKITHFHVRRDSAKTIDEMFVGGCATYFFTVEGEVPERAKQYATFYKLRKGFSLNKSR